MQALVFVEQNFYEDWRLTPDGFHEYEAQKSNWKKLIRFLDVFNFGKIKCSLRYGLKVPC